jgi:hypothetical protein
LGLLGKGKSQSYLVPKHETEANPGSFPVSWSPDQVQIADFRLDLTIELELFTHLQELPLYEVLMCVLCVVMQLMQDSMGLFRAALLE